MAPPLRRSARTRGRSPSPGPGSEASAATEATSLPPRKRARTTTADVAAADNAAPANAAPVAASASASSAEDNNNIGAALETAPVLASMTTAQPDDTHMDVDAPPVQEIAQSTDIFPAPAADVPVTGANADKMETDTHMAVDVPVAGPDAVETCDAPVTAAPSGDGTPADGDSNGADRATNSSTPAGDGNDDESGGGSVRDLAPPAADFDIDERDNADRRGPEHANQQNLDDEIEHRARAWWYTFPSEPPAAARTTPIQAGMTPAVLQQLAAQIQAIDAEVDVDANEDEEAIEERPNELYIGQLPSIRIAGAFPIAVGNLDDQFAYRGSMASSLATLRQVSFPVLTVTAEGGEKHCFVMPATQVHADGAPWTTLAAQRLKVQDFAKYGKYVKANSQSETSFPVDTKDITSTVTTLVDFGEDFLLNAAQGDDDEEDAGDDDDVAAGEVADGSPARAGRDADAMDVDGAVTAVAADIAAPVAAASTTAPAAAPASAATTAPTAAAAAAATPLRPRAARPIDPRFAGMDTLTRRVVRQMLRADGQTDEADTDEEAVEPAAPAHPVDPRFAGMDTPTRRMVRQMLRTDGQTDEPDTDDERAAADDSDEEEDAEYPDDMEGLGVLPHSDDAPDGEEQWEDAAELAAVPATIQAARLPSPPPRANREPRGEASGIFNPALLPFLSRLHPNDPACITADGWHGFLRSQNVDSFRVAFNPETGELSTTGGTLVAQVSLRHGFVLDGEPHQLANAPDLMTDDPHFGWYCRDGQPVLASITTEVTHQVELLQGPLSRYIRFVIRTHPAERYPDAQDAALCAQLVPIKNGEGEIETFTPRARTWQYRIVMYLDTRALFAAVRQGEPGLLTAIRRFVDSEAGLRLLVFGQQAAKLPDALAVPDVSEREIDETALAPTPAGFKKELYDYQQRTLGWLLRCERDVASRTISVLPSAGISSESDAELSFHLTSETSPLPRIVRIGETGMLYHTYRHQMSDRDIWTPLIPETNRVECRGAIEASKVGTGKTVVALALIMANPFRSVRDFPISAKMPWEARQYLPSRATIVVCRSDLTAQWRAEALTGLPDTARVVVLTTMVEHKKLSWNQILLADIVILSTAFLRNANYQKHVCEVVGQTKYQYPLPYEGSKTYPTENVDEVKSFSYALSDFTENMVRRGRAEWGTDVGKVILERIFWHRVIVDEAHEFIADTTNAGEAQTKEQIRQAAQPRHFIEAMRTRFILGLTGSPPVETPERVIELASLLHVRNLPVNRPTAVMYLSQMSRAANPDLRLPPVHPRTIMVQMTPNELALAADAGNNGGGDQARFISHTELREMQLMALQHHQITEEMVSLAGGSGVVSVETMTATLQEQRQQEMARMEERLVYYENQVEVWYFTLSNLITRCPQHRDIAVENGADVNRIPKATKAKNKRPMTKEQLDENKEDIRSKTTQIRSFQITTISALRTRLGEITRQHAFMDSVIRQVSQGEEVECIVCMEETISAGRQGVILRCGHIFCPACVKAIQRTKDECPTCRCRPITNPVTMKWPAKRLSLADQAAAKAAEKPEEDDEADQDLLDGALDYSKYGSKIKALAKYTLRVIKDDPDAKLILFCQFKRLSELISQAFTELNVSNVRLSGGNVYVKRKALTAFKTDPNMKVIFLSYQDCVSGLHLTEANHVVLCHTFLARDEATAKAYEMQGIARAVRAGQRREVHVTRFVCENTLEHEIHRSRASPLTDAEVQALAAAE